MINRYDRGIVYTSKGGDAKLSAKFNFILPDDLLQRVKDIAKEKNSTVSAIIKDLLTEFANNESSLDDLRKRVEALEKEVFKK